jgi:hypothetical protein
MGHLVELGKCRNMSYYICILLSNLPYTQKRVSMAVQITRHITENKSSDIYIRSELD